MVVTSSCLAFRALITQARVGKRFRVQNSTNLLYLPIPSSAETWKIVSSNVSSCKCEDHNEKISPK